ncbi:MAG: ABC transporter ATP-binding protein, partial [Gemmatimonadetes bacterium]|nr:ABC transporter ATP-binding protein [Gemmatimonadota bacterium]
PQALRAVDGVDLAVPAGATLGLVGESGSGKSTVARTVVGLVRAQAGQVLLSGVDVVNASGENLRSVRRTIQMVFQDPFSSLNPRMTVGETLEEAATIHRQMSTAARSAEVLRLLDLVGLEVGARERYPHQLSGGQCQRVAIARALATRARVLLLDEITSSLDVSVQASILNLMRNLQREFALSYLYISHDLSVVRYMSDRVCVMYLGRIVESAPTLRFFASPRHPYSKALVAAVPRMRSARGGAVPLRGDIPDPSHLPSGCRFRSRCPIGPLADPTRTICIELDPPTQRLSAGGTVACHFPLDPTQQLSGGSLSAHDRLGNHFG